MRLIPAHIHSVMADRSDSDASSDASVSDSIAYPPNTHDGQRQIHHRPQEPLINFVKNEWRDNPKYYDGDRRRRRRPQHPPWINEYDDLPEWLESLVLILSAPKVRRNGPILFLSMIVLFCLWKIVITPQLTDHEQLTKSLDPGLKESVGGWFGSNVLPEFDDLIKVASLDETRHGAKRKRLIVIGDVHGCKAECMSTYIYPLALAVSQPFYHSGKIT